LLGEAHFVLAQALELYDWNWSEAERQYKLALELSPNYAHAHEEYGRFPPALLGRNDEAMKQMAYAAELNPMDLRIREMVGLVTYAARQYDSAISQFKELNASYPETLPLAKAAATRAVEVDPVAGQARRVAEGFGTEPMKWQSFRSSQGSGAIGWDARLDMTFDALCN
jgi:tetratricopeptide (TPR) repeat protein